MVYNTVCAQDIIFEDSNLKLKLIELGHDQNLDNEISVAEAEIIEFLDLTPPYNTETFEYYNQITDLSGLEFFTSLGELILNNNLISSIDLGDLISLTKLTCIECELTSVTMVSNLKLEELILWLNWELDELDLALLTNLKVVSLRNMGIDKVDIGNLTELENLTIKNCKISTLDVSTNPKLKVLDLRTNPLTYIKIEGNDSLLDINLSYTELKYLDVLGAPNLENLNCVICDLDSIHVSGLTKLTNLNLGQNNLKVLDVQNNVSLFHISCYDNKLEEILFDNNEALEYVYFDDNNLSKLDLMGAPNIKKVECRNNDFVTLKIENSSIETFYCSGNVQFTEMDICKAPNMIYIVFYDMPQPFVLRVKSLEMTNSMSLITDDDAEFTIETCISSTTYFDESSFIIFPNPITDEVSVRFEQGFNQPVNISLYDSYGRMIYQQNAVDPQHLFRLSTSEYPNGIYHMNFQRDQSLTSKRVVIKK